MKKFMLRRIGVADERARIRPSLQACIEVVLQQAHTLIDDVLEGLANSVTRAPGNAAFVTQSEEVKTAIEGLCAHAHAVRETFNTLLRDQVYNGAAKETEEQPLLRFDDLQLLDARQIDANIEFAQAQQEVARGVDDVLPALNALVSSLLGWITVQPQLNPLKPDAFVRALHGSLLAHVTDEAARSQLITPAFGFLGVSLRQLYREVNDWLRSQGVEPASSGRSLMPGVAKSSEAESSVTRTLVTLDKLRKLLSGELGTAPGASAQDFMHTVPASLDALEDLKLVGSMMKRLTQRASMSAVAASIAKSSGAPVAPEQVEREQTQSRQLGKQLGEEVVRMMLENLMQDDRLLVPVRDQIRQLEPALLRLSHADPRFFSDRQHPARQFLDMLTSRSLAYTQAQDEGFSRFLKSISNAISVLTRGEGDAAAFDRVFHKLEDGWAREEAVQRARQEEAARALLHAEQRNLLAQRLADDFKARQVGKDVPDLVAGFLRGPWAQVVAESQLRCVNGAADPDGFLALVDDLLWSVQLRVIRRNRTRLVQMVPNLLVKIRQGLQLIAYPQERVPVFFDALISLHEKAFEGPRMGAVPDSLDVEIEPASLFDEINAREDAEAEAFWVADHEASESGYVAGDSARAASHSAARDSGELRPWSAGDLVTGSWVELTVSGQWVRAQLTWASPHRTLFMFISHGGLAHSMSKRTMERLRMRGLIRVVSDGRLVDNALDAIAQTALQNDIGHTGSSPLA